MRKLTMEGGKRNLLFANSRLFCCLLSLFYFCAEKQSTHTRSVYLSYETQSTDSENGLKVRSPVYKVERHDHEISFAVFFFTQKSFFHGIEESRLINL